MISAADPVKVGGGHGVQVVQTGGPPRIVDPNATIRPGADHQITFGAEVPTSPLGAYVLTVKASHEFATDETALTLIVTETET